MALQLKKPSVLPGFGLTMGFTVFYLSALVLIPLGGLVLKSSTMGWARFVDTVTRPEIVAAYRLSLGASLTGGLVNAVFGFLVAWVLGALFVSRQEADRRPGRSALCPAHGRLGDCARARFMPATAGLAGCSREASKSRTRRWGVVVVLTFIGLPFVVRTLQPALEDLDPAIRRGGRQPRCRAAYKRSSA